MADGSPDGHIVPEVEEAALEGDRDPEFALQDDVRPDGGPEAMEVAAEDDPEVVIVEPQRGGDEGVRDPGNQDEDQRPASVEVDGASAWAQQFDLWARTCKDMGAELTPPAGAPPSRPNSALLASLTTLVHDLSDVLHGEHQRYSAYYAEPSVPAELGEGSSRRPVEPTERRPGAGRTVAEADAELARIQEALEQDDMAIAEGRDLVLDPTRHASLYPLPRAGTSEVPVAYTHMLWARPNNQGKLVLRSTFPLDQNPEEVGQRRPYHTLKPLPCFPPTHRGFGRKFYR